MVRRALGSFLRLAAKISRMSELSSERARRPDCLLRRMFVGSMPILRASSRMMLGSIEPLRVPMGMPSSGLRPMLVSMDWPSLLAVIDEPLPRWQEMMRARFFFSNLRVLAMTNLWLLPWKP